MARVLADAMLIEAEPTRLTGVGEVGLVTAQNVPGVLALSAASAARAAGAAGAAGAAAGARGVGVARSADTLTLEDLLGVLLGLLRGVC